MIDGVARKIYIPGTDPAQFEQTNIPMLGILAFITMASFVAASFAVTLLNNNAEGRSKGKGTYVYMFSVMLLSLLLGVYVYLGASNPAISIRVQPYSFALIACIWLFSALLAVFNTLYDGLVKGLPSARKLDDMCYKAIMVAFPIMTLILVTGAVWANNAWGRYWGWDPKETASLVTWIIYLVYLHTRYTRGWKGRRAAFVSIIGFVSVVFTYLGVNLLLSGLHAYAR
jgi:cytochrome c-type biogenesis protein CcsB